MKPPKTQTNNPAIAGQLASKKLLHGDFHEYATYAIHTRGESVAWLTADARIPDELTGLPSVIRQASTFQDALCVE